MRILVTGASGLVGRALLPSLEAAGHTVGRISRRERSGPGSSITWDPAVGIDPPESLAGWDAIVHLAGLNLASGPWTRGRKRRFRESRITYAAHLVEAATRVDAGPRVLVSASAVGYYGDCGGEVLDESAAPGEGFLAELCYDWEEAARPAAAAGVRVVHLRFGLLLAPGAGLLAKLTPVFRLGLGGPFGNGEQWMSWAHVDDVVEACRSSVVDDTREGPYNVVSPEPVTNRDFARTLGKVLRRPAVVRVPAFALRLLPGGMGRDAFLGSQRALPRRLIESGFAFRVPLLETALRRALDRRAAH